MKKTFLLFGLLLLTGVAHRALAQVSFNHSIGGFYAATSKYSIRYRDADGKLVRDEGRLAGVGVVYAPRLNLVEIGYNSSLSISTRLGVGVNFSGVVSSQTDAPSSSSLMLDVPVILDFNHGTASVYDNDNAFGWYFGIGAGYNKMGGGESIKFYTGSYGPMVNGGVRFNVNERYFDVRTSYMLDINQAELNVFTLGLSYYLGMQTDY
ncbi:MAG TPA: hypothetical protein VEY71_12900 [Chitinophagales bacterium]|nr:hypothetical protein [Chitinophagales bacterium]